MIRPLLAVACALLLSTTSLEAQPPAESPTTTLERLLTDAERALRLGEPQLAESRYREALYEGWLLRGALARASGNVDAAIVAFEHAARSAFPVRRAHLALAGARVALGQADDAILLLQKLLGRDPQDLEVRRNLAQALVATGRNAEAIQELEELRSVSAGDPEVEFMLATGYLRTDRPDDAARLFDEIAEQRPLPETWILIGRTYRDFGEIERARAALESALDLDPEVRRARFYLGTLELLDEGRLRLDEAMAHFDDELRLAPGDPIASLYLGMALVEARRHEEALPYLETAVATETPAADAFHFLGRARLRLGNAEHAAEALRRALELATQRAESTIGRLDASQSIANAQLGSIHFQLGQALRRQGDANAAAEHLAAAERYSSEVTESARESMSRYLSDEIQARSSSPLRLTEPSESPGNRELDTAISRAMAQAYLNLGVLRLQGALPSTGSPSAPDDAARLQAEHSARAAEYFEHAAELAPNFPRAQFSLGVARFNAGQHADAVEPLALALAEDPANTDLRRMLALSHLETESYAEAARLLRDDSGRAENPSLQYAYGLALVRSGRAAEAGPVFDALLATHAEWPELVVLLGQANAQQGDYDAAVATLKRALELRPDIAGAHATLGVLHLRRGELEDAETALRAELEHHPGDLRTRFHLATVLDLRSAPEDARGELLRVLEQAPSHADARYLLGKILLAGGEAGQAVEQLEAAVELAPEDPNVHYQLAQAYQRLGRRELAVERLGIYRALKDAERKETP